MTTEIHARSELTALGLMSGTSRDGIDAAIIRTDGSSVVNRGPSTTWTYGEEFRRRLSDATLNIGDASGVEAELTALHANVIDKLLEKNQLTYLDIDIIGFHGHTLFHAPEQRETIQIGDGKLLASLTGIPVVNDLRSADVAEGGQGAPLAPAYHWALAKELEKPVAVLNMGGVANVTWIGDSPPNLGDFDTQDQIVPQMLAFDTGPGNALLDDWTARHTGERYDRDGRLAATGNVDADALARLLENPYFSASPPKSLDRDAFSLEPLALLSPADGAATLVAFTTQTVSVAADFLPSPPTRWLVTGGGRHNPEMMSALTQQVGAPVAPVESVGWDGNTLEAEAFAFLAVRSVKGWPNSWLNTTGVPRPCVGGVLHRP
tara:strand:+ start:223 stop:1353 length:1131 start_codon:yes stop_codon:yes gene_type:complete